MGLQTSHADACIFSRLKTSNKNRFKERYVGTHDIITKSGSQCYVFYAEVGAAADAGQAEAEALRTAVRVICLQVEVARLTAVTARPAHVCLPNRSGQVRSGQVRSGQVRSDGIKGTLLDAYKM